MLTLIINGSPKKVEATALSYAEVIDIAWGKAQRDELYTITYRTRQGGQYRSGTLCPGQRIALEDGMVFNALSTSKA